MPLTASLHRAPLELSARAAVGKRLRAKLSRAEHGEWSAARNRAHVVEQLIAANRGRLPHLLPIKYGRMSASPFAFFRGAAPVMAADLRSSPVTGLAVQMCGDAHVRNLGAYAAPDGHLVFDINDFDETLPGPWEWDVKRLAASAVLAGREAGNGDADCGDAAETLVRAYRKALRRFAKMKVLELARYEVQRHLRRGPVREVLAKAAHATPRANLDKLTGGRDRRFVHQPPLLHHLPQAQNAKVIRGLAEYRDSLGPDHQVVFDAYRPADVAFKVVGTGSIGTRDYIVLLFGNGERDPMFLQVKEELPSCYAAYLRGAAVEHQGRRVAEGQHRMQTVSDPLLGWTTIERGHYLVRQLRDHKASVEPADLKGEALEEYCGVAGEVLAKAHARTGDAAALAGYCGKSGRLDRALRKFAVAYADQTERDYEQLLGAIRAGKIKAVKGV